MQELVIKVEKNLQRLNEIGSRDHSVTNEYRIFGPPGTGKTTHVARQVHLAAAKFGTGSVLVTSFSKAAATELAGKSLPISGHNLGTLHSHCYGALGSPEVAECQVEEWNRRHPRLRMSSKNRRARIDGENSGAPDEQEHAYAGDDLLRELNRWRGMMAPADSWPRGLREFQAKMGRIQTSAPSVGFHRFDRERGEGHSRRPQRAQRAFCR